MTKRTNETTNQEADASFAAEAPATPDLTIPALAATPGDDGYYGDADWIRVECDWTEPGFAKLKPRDGFPPLFAEIDASLTIREALAIPLEAGIPMTRLFPHLAPRVRAWNVREWDAEAGAMVPVPPPAEIGAEAFLRCRPLVVEWLGYVLRTYSLSGGPNRKNGTSSSDDGPDGPSDGA